MIIAGGKVCDAGEQEKILSRMEAEINETLSQKTLGTETVVKAIDELGERLRAGRFDGLIAGLRIDGIERYRREAERMLSREYIEFKLKTELGREPLPSYTTSPPKGFERIGVDVAPLGVILHIAAGNVDGLPAFSLAEGLLTGNINILKLPQADNGLSVSLVLELLDIEPALSDFIYVFDTPSSDVSAIRRMAELADGIAVWGGDAAVAAVRRFAAPGTRLIEWGHKLSFAYISGYEDERRELSALARHIVSTKQLLCSSCQTIFIDTDKMEDVYDFCGVFLPYLESAAEAALPSSIGGEAELTLRRYTARIEGILTGGDTFSGALCGLRPAEDSELSLSEMFGFPNVKRLPERDLMASLRRKKGYLQTAGLICAPERRQRLTASLARCGVSRITGAGDMSDAFAGEAHDGEYPLRRYLRVVNTVIH